MALSITSFQNCVEQIERMVVRMSWQQVCEVGRKLFVPVMMEHGQIDTPGSKETVLGRQADDLLQSLYKQGKDGDPAAARVFLQEASKTRAIDEASNVIINIVPYDIADKVEVEIEGYEGDNDTGVGDAEEVPLGNR